MTHDTHLDEIEVVDQRNHDFFIIDNEIIDEYLPRIGAAAFTLYCTIVRWAYRRGSVKISLNELCDKTGMSKPTVVEKLKVLESEETRLIVKSGQTDPKGNPLPNSYRLCPIQKKRKSEPPTGTTPKPAKPAESPLSDDQAAVKRELEEVGVSPANARRFVTATYVPTTFVGTRFEWLREQIASLPYRNPGNPGRVLTDAVNGMWALHPAYLKEKAKQKRRQGVVSQSLRQQADMQAGIKPDGIFDATRQNLSKTPPPKGHYLR